MLPDQLVAVSPAYGLGFGSRSFIRLSCQLAIHVGVPYSKYGRER
jgi:hypothetical protein